MLPVGDHDPSCVHMYSSLDENVKALAISVWYFNVASRSSKVGTGLREVTMSELFSKRHGIIMM